MTTAYQTLPNTDEEYARLIFDEWEIHVLTPEELGDVAPALQRRIEHAKAAVIRAEGDHGNIDKLAKMAGRDAYAAVVAARKRLYLHQSISRAFPENQRRSIEATDERLAREVGAAVRAALVRLDSKHRAQTTKRRLYTRAVHRILSHRHSRARRVVRVAAKKTTAKAAADPDGEPSRRTSSSRGAL